MPSVRYGLSCSLSFALAVAVAACGGSGSSWTARQARLEQQPGQAATVDKLSRRELTFGAVVGAFGPHTSHVWRGLPYARPPVGALRWKAPRPVEPWDGVRELLSDRAPCPQLRAEPGAQPEAAGDEDCLYLDLYAPAMNRNLALTRRLPVLFWIHGGGNLRGRAADYDAGRLALQRQVLVVVPNHRLGALGWFAHPALQAETETAAEPFALAEPEDGAVRRYATPQQAAAAALASDDRSGNYGTLDLIAALLFVRDNIARFGGDPENVTLIGDGSGGGNVLSLLLSPRAKGLFEHAIAQSPSFALASTSEAAAYREDGGAPWSSAEVLLRLLIQAGRAASREQARALATSMSAEQTRQFLRAQPAAALLAAAAVPRVAGDDRPAELPNALRDGAVIGADDPLARFARGDYHRVPLLLGSNRDEARRHQASNPELVELTPDGPKIRDPERYALLAEYRSEAFRADLHGLAQVLQRAQPEQLWVYRFDWDEEPHAPIDYRRLLGAGHGIELDFVLGLFDARERGRRYDAAGERSREKLARAITSYWAELAYSGDPGAGRTGELQTWEPWGDEGQLLVLDTVAGGDVRMAKGGASSVAALLRRLAGDARAPQAIDKCRLLYWLTERGNLPTSAVASTPELDCRAYPPAGYPWDQP